jgi:multidrug efflux system membrane fusion protein
LDFVDNTVNKTTGTIRLRATFANASRRLWPGQFVEALFKLTEEPDALTVPSEAIQTGQQGLYVFVVKPDQTAEVRPVKTRRSVNGETVIETGLQPGETVVTDGHLRVLPGGKVEIKTGLQ